MFLLSKVSYFLWYQSSTPTSLETISHPLQIQKNLNLLSNSFIIVHIWSLFDWTLQIFSYSTPKLYLYFIVLGFFILSQVRKSQTNKSNVTKGNEGANPFFLLWVNNEGLLTWWLLGFVIEIATDLTFGAKIEYRVWTLLEKQVLLATTKKQ